MHEFYNDYFERRTSGRARMPEMRRSDVNLLSSWIPKNSTWDSDAIYYLMYNLHFMLIAPFRARNEDFRLTQGPHGTNTVVSTLRDYSGLEQAFNDDINSIVTLANEIARNRDRGYVSSTTVAMAIGRLAPDLKTTEWQVWGPRIEDGSTS